MRLLVDLSVGFSSYGKLHVAEPDLHRTAQLDLTGVGPDRLALQEKQDEASIAAIRHAKRLAGAVSAALDEHGEVVALALPYQIGLRLMRQACQRKTAVGEAHPLGVVGKHLVGRFNHLPFVLGRGLPARFLNAILQDELMDLGHSRHACR
jgi:hypothetical protein